MTWDNQMRFRQILIKVLVASILSSLIYYASSWATPPGIARELIPPALAQFVVVACLLMIYPDEFALPKSKSNTYAARLAIISLSVLGYIFYSLPLFL